MEDSKNKNYFNKTPFKLKSSSVNKITLHQMLFLSQDNDENLKLSRNNINTKTKNICSLKKTYHKPNPLNISEKKWPKITHPKLPFSQTYKGLNESKIIKIKLTKPSKTLHGFNTIKWLRTKYSDSVIEKSIHSILPKQIKNVKYKDEEEHHKRHRKMIEYLDSFKGPIGKEKYININPKYLFDETTFKKLLKLKEVFLEFDISGNHKMEFDEIVKMFNENHITAGKNDIFNLFFKHKIIKKENDIKKLHLGFYQFIVFALKREQEFRDFMRKIKLKYKKKENNEYNNNDKNEKDEKDENVYLPMNFNLVLDYFIKKEKERYSINKLKTAFDKLDNDIKNENYNNKSCSKNNETNELNNNYKKSYRRKSNCRKTIREKKILSDVNFIELFKDFINLFYMTCKNEDNNDHDHDNDREYSDVIKNEFNKTPYKSRNNTEPKPKKRITEIDNSILSNNKYNLKRVRKRNNKSKFGNFILKTEKIKNTNNNDIIGLIKNHMNKTLINKLNIQNYEKYHDVNLARDETLKQIKKELKIDKLYMKSKEIKKNDLFPED